MRYDLRDLHLLVSVAEAGGIAAAARRVNLSVSALSERISAMEESAGIPLFVRGPRGSRPTAAGQEVIAQAKAVLLQAERFTGAIAALRGRERGRIRFLCNTNALASFVPDALARYLAQNPDVVVDLQEALSDEIGRKLRAGEADIGVAAGNANLSGLSVRPFRRDRLVALVPAGHRVSHRASIGFHELVDEPFVGLDSGAAIQVYLAEQAARLGVSLNLRMHLRSFDSVARMVAAGVGVAVLPASAVTRVQREAGVRMIRLTDAWAERELVICMSGSGAISAIALRLADVLSEDRFRERLM